MSKELTKEEAEEFFNKLWLENKDLIQENMNKLSMERFELELELVDKNKEIERLNKCYCERTDCSGRIKNSKKYESMQEEIERLNNIIKEFDKLIENEINESKLEDDYERVDSLEYCLATLKELKGENNE